MTKRAESEQAYAEGFALKCAELGVDAVKLAQAVSEPQLPDRGLRSSGMPGRLDQLAGTTEGRCSAYPGASTRRLYLGPSARLARILSAETGVPTGIRPNALESTAGGGLPLLTPEERMRLGVVGAYDRLRTNKPPAEAEEALQSKGGVDNDLIKKLRELISRGIIQVGNRRPGAATTAEDGE